MKSEFLFGTSFLQESLYNRFQVSGLDQGGVEISRQTSSWIARNLLSPAGGAISLIQLQNDFQSNTVKQYT
jgi:hypothetical protein